MSRIAILEADTPMQKVQERYGKGYGDIFKPLFSKAAQSLKMPDPAYSVFDIRLNPSEYPDPSKLDAIIITGSRYNSYDCDDWIMRLVEFCGMVYRDYPHVKLIGKFAKIMLKKKIKIIHLIKHSLFQGFVLDIKY